MRLRNDQIETDPLPDAELNEPEAVAVDASGNIAIADQFDIVIWVVAAAAGVFYGQAMTAGDIYVVAGPNGTSLGTDGLGTDGLGTDGLGDGGPATQASLGLVSVAISPSGDLLVADAGNRRIRSISR